MSNTIVCLWHIEGGMQAGRRLNVPIHLSPFLIGRDQGCHLTVTAPGVSRRHLQLEIEGNKLFVSDIGSTNGTFVNRTKVEGRVEISSGDALHLGKEELRIIKQAGATDTKSFLLDQDVESTVMININDPMLDLGETFVRQEKEFKAMIADKEVAVVFQPIVSFIDHEIIGYEALGRGVRKDLPISPLGLFDIAEKLGKAKELSSVFRTKAVETSIQLPGSPLLFVNTHPAENLRKGLLDNIKELRQKTGPWRVVLEIHESAVTDTAMMAELKAILRDYEIYLAYDDFGAGQARWNELVEVPPDYLKFDLKLIRDIHLKTAKKQDMVRKLVEICLDQGSHPLAECVENSEELEICRELGFTHGQGYLFGKPQPISFFVDDV